MFDDLDEDGQEEVLGEVTQASHSCEFYDLLGNVERGIAIRLENAVHGIINAATVTAFNLGIRRSRSPD